MKPIITLRHLVYATLACITISVTQALGQKIGPLESNCTFFDIGLLQPTHFTWTGGCNNGYLNGSGLLTFKREGKDIGYYSGNMTNGKMEGEGVLFYSNGKKWLEGTFTDNALTGWGKKYSWEGDLKFEGPFEKNRFYNIDQFNNESISIVRTVVEKIYDGGTNIHSKVIGFRRLDQSLPYSGKNMVVEIRISFNGDIMTDNYYELTLKAISGPNGPTFSLEDRNDMALGYNITKAGIELGRLAGEFERLFGND